MKQREPIPMKPNAYTRMYIHIIFAVKYRMALIQPSWREELNKYITGICKNTGHKMLAIGGVENHIHIFIGLNPNQSISDLVRIIKSESSNWINEKGFCQSKFVWQSGYGAFSYERELISQICDYIDQQEEHHRTENFRDEYERILQENGIDYDPKYLFEDPI